jgi:uncharacterized membrane protein YqaE (UPF0057 family)
MSSFWRRWLVASAFGVLLFGLGLVLLPAATQRLFNLLYFSSSRANLSFGPAEANYIRFVCSVLGAVMVGWAVALIFVIFGSFRRGLREGWNLIAISLIAWFLPDTAVSLAYGFWQNALLNLAIAVLFAIPLGFTFKAFHSAGG